MKERETEVKFENAFVFLNIILFDVIAYIITNNTVQLVQREMS